MPAVMRLTVLLSLLAVTVCKGLTTSSTDKPVTETTTRAAQHSSVTVTDISLVNVKTTTTTTTTQQPPTTTHQLTTKVTSEQTSLSSPLPSTSPQTPSRTEETRPSVTAPQTTTTNQTSNETVSHGPTRPNATATAVNTTSAGLSPGWGKDDLASNPGLVAVICIFCIVFVLLLVVATMKCLQSPRSNFERLEDVPMGKVNEGSPFAQYSK